jgi:hypothetical protein
MSQTISSVAAIFRSMVSLVLLGIVGTGGWLAYQAFDRQGQLQRELEAKSVEIKKLTADNARLDLAMRLLKVDHRVAEIEVLDQWQAVDRTQTKLKFVEVAKDGTPIGAEKVFTIDGDLIYVDAWVIKYEDELIEKADPLRSTSVCLFRRAFGEFQQPDQGFPLDAFGSRPSVYSQGEEMSPAERDIWDHFWEYANTPAKAQKAGLRAVHGEAPSMKLQPGKRYRVELRASGGLSIKPIEEPSKSPPEA